MIASCFSKPLLPSPHTPPVHLCLALVRLVSWAALEEISYDLALHSKTQVIREDSSHRISLLAPLSSTSCFQVQRKVKALWMHSPDFTTRQTGGAVLRSLTRLHSIYSFTCSSSLIFISLAQAFTAINTVAKVSFSHAVIH